LVDLLRSNNIDIVIDEKSAYFVRTIIFATHISPWIGMLFDSNIASSSINSRRPGMKSIFFAGIARIRRSNRDSSKTIAIDS